MPALGSRMESNKASLPSLVPISVRAGPKSDPSVPTWWQPMQLTVGRRKITAPFEASPVHWSNSAMGGSARSPWTTGGGSTRAASAFSWGQRTAFSSVVAIPLTSGGKRSSLAKAIRPTTPSWTRARDFTARRRKATSRFVSTTSGIKSGEILFSAVTPSKSIKVPAERLAASEGLMRSLRSKARIVFNASAAAGSVGFFNAKSRRA